MNGQELREQEIKATKKLYAYLLNINENSEVYEQKFFYEGGDWFDMVIWKYLIDSGFNPEHLGTVLFSCVIRALVESIPGINITVPMEKIDGLSGRKIRKQIHDVFDSSNGSKQIFPLNVEENLVRIIPIILMPKVIEATDNYIFPLRDIQPVIDESFIGESFKKIKDAYNCSFFGAEVTGFIPALTEILRGLQAGFNASAIANEFDLNNFEPHRLARSKGVEID